MSAQPTTSASSVSHHGATPSGLLSIEEQTQLLNLQRAILKSIARGADHMEVIIQTCLLAESLLNNGFSSVMLMDDNYEFLNVYAAPSLTPIQIQRANAPVAARVATSFTSKPSNMSAIPSPTSAGKISATSRMISTLKPAGLSRFSLPKTR